MYVLLLVAVRGSVVRRYGSGGALLRLDAHLEPGRVYMSRNPHEPQPFSLHLGKLDVRDIVCGGEPFRHRPCRGELAVACSGGARGLGNGMGGGSTTTEVQ